MPISLLLFIVKATIKLEDNGLTEIIIAKHRNGATGEVNLAFEKNFSRFSDLAPIGPDGGGQGVRDVRG